MDRFSCRRRNNPDFGYFTLCNAIYDAHGAYAPRQISFFRPYPHCYRRRYHQFLAGAFSPKSETIVTGSFNMKIVLFFVFIILISLTSVAYAHGLYLSSKEGRLYAHFSDHSPASGAVVTVVDEDGIEIIRDTMDEKGMWALPKDMEGEPRFVIVEATGGHLTQIAWQEVLQGTSKGFFDYLSIRIAIGVMVLGGGGFFIKHLLNPKSKMSMSPPSTRIGT